MQTLDASFMHNALADHAVNLQKNDCLDYKTMGDGSEIELRSLHFYACM